MGYKLFLDINILIDFLDNQRANHDDAVKLISEVEAGNCDAFVTESVLNTTSYLVRKDYPLPKLKILLLDILSFADLIPVTSVMYISGIQTALTDLEDAVLYTAALNAKADFFITNDIKDFKKLEVPRMPAVTAKEFLSFI